MPHFVEFLLEVELGLDFFGTISVPALRKVTIKYQVDLFARQGGSSVVCSDHAAHDGSIRVSVAGLVDGFLNTSVVCCIRQQQQQEEGQNECVLQESHVFAGVQHGFVPIAFLGELVAQFEPAIH